MESRERRAMALQYHPANRGSHGRRLLLGGSVTAQHLQLPWLSRQAARYYDSDDDSGIGHSNGGQGDRVGSTSSTETEVPQLSPGNLQKWWGTGSEPRRPDGPRQISPGLPLDSWLHHQQRVPSTGPISLTSGFCPPAVSTPEGSECADDVFHPSKAALVRLPGPNRSWKRGAVEPRGKKSTLQREPLACANARQAQNGLAVRVNPPESRPKSSKGTLQKCKSFNYNSGPSQAERRGLGEGRRVWSYCGDGNYYPNVYENVRLLGSSLPSASQDAPLGRTRPNEASNGQKATRAIPWKDREVSYLNREVLAHHYDVPVLRSGGGTLRENSRLHGAKSASLSSLITENDLVRVHAFPASVIPASEIGDTLSDSFYVQHCTVEQNSQYVQQPPPPPPPPMGVPLRVPVGLPRPRPQSIPSGTIEPQNFYVGSPPVQSIRHAGRESSFKDCSIKEISTPVCTAGEVAYATVIKPKHKMNAGQKAAPYNCSPASAFLDEIEPPLPPRNYRRDLASSKHLTTSKSSLTDKMHGFSRTAKQALRQAFSLEGLNCASESAHNDSDEWDNESDWGRIINPKPRTPSAVKARDANRQKLKRSNSAKHPTTMATLC